MLLVKVTKATIVVSYGEELYTRALESVDSYGSSHANVFSCVNNV